MVVDTSRASESSETSKLRWARALPMSTSPYVAWLHSPGLANIQDAESVDEVLGLEPTSLKFAKKQLRVQRARTLPAAVPKTKTQPHASASTAKPASSAAKAPAVKPTSFKQTAIGPVPKGNPMLGEKIRGLSKEERKAAKSEDIDRQARRLAKKKLRGKMGAEVEKGAVKLIATKGEKASRKKVVAKKGRVRSSNALAKMKGSRA